MNGRSLISIAVLLVASCIAGGSACAQTSQTTQPMPPPQLCVNAQCATTQPPSASPPPAAHSIKWNPGHYMASYTILFPGDSISKVQAEMDDLNNQDAMIGYRIEATWGALEPTPGNYDFSLVDAILARLKTQYNKPKHLVIMLWMYSNGIHHNNGGSIIPAYIQEDPKYGASPVAGSFGWWGQNSQGASTGLYAPALYYPPVMDRFIGMIQALGKHLDGDPNLEALFVQEDATVAGAGSNVGANAGVDPHYSDNAWATQLKRLLSASTAAFPHTSVILANSWLNGPTETVALEPWMANNRIAMGSADTMGQTGIDTYGTTKSLSWGLQYYMGAYPGSMDLRPKMTAMMDVEGPDMFTTTFRNVGGPFTPLDLINALNQTYQASHAFWTRLTGSQYPSAAQWPNLAATCAAHPLTRTAYPANYP